MAIAVVFTPPSMNATQYDECIRRLESAGQGKPAGRLYHACYGTSGRLNVFDVWDSNESFDAFGKVLMPILKELEIDSGKPAVSEIHNIIIVGG